MPDLLSYLIAKEYEDIHSKLKHPRSHAQAKHLKVYHRHDDNQVPRHPRQVYLANEEGDAECWDALRESLMQICWRQETSTEVRGR
ncbi:hypothetical protein HPP92_010919 [Vanilla planifolia]|uniref:Uncharacterized protein n=1 Tax=Vanilla planifolia TaxID=51239 RepID=A0A835QZI8_VANPL|nr:hypothetical protein HPP92_010919 [Vanilla planifolia]